MDPLARTLNNQILESSPAVFDCLSEEGKNMFYPAGILTQAAEAKEKAKKFDATIGIAIEQGDPMHLAVTRRFFNELDLHQIYTYAPPGGRPKLREFWKESMICRNPTLTGKAISLPMVTNALTHGLCVAGELFVGPNDVVLIPDKNWGVYRLNFMTRKGGRIETFPMFNAKDGFNTKGLENHLAREAKKRKKVVLILCFPNNPTGYTPLKNEVHEIYRIVREQAEKGTTIVVLSDDAYFGLFYENSFKESLFSGFCDLHENVLAVKLDGATKESYVWGFRTGFITFGNKTPHPDKLYSALEMKAQGVIRSTVSSCNHVSQSIIETVLREPEYQKNLDEKYDIMKGRALRLKRILNNEKYKKYWKYYPFNSGYFMCLKLRDVNAETLRLHLLDTYGVGTISTSDTDLRIAFSCIEEDQIEELVELIFQATRDLS